MTWLLFVLLTQYQPPRAGTLLDDAAQEAQAQRVGKTIRCAVCQGLSVADSPAPMAQAMMDRIRDQVREGKGDDEIRAFFEQRYGEFILLKPKAVGLNWIVWLGPLAIAAGGLALIATRLRRSVATPPSVRPDATAARAEAPIDAELLARVRHEVDE